MSDAITFSVSEPIFGRTTYFTFGGEWLSFMASVEKRYSRDNRLRNQELIGNYLATDPTGLCWHYDDGDNAVYVSARADLAKPEGQGVLVHECIHAANHVGDVVGINRSEDAEEFFAHYAQFLYQRAMRKLIR